MESSFWHKCWERNTLSFHQSDVHPLLTQYLPKLVFPSDTHVFVPLCGKTLDMVYLAQFMQVSGNEISAIACKDFFIDNDIRYKRQTLGDFEHFSCQQLSLWQGDFFKLSADIIGNVDLIYDRAALIALPPKMQQSYANQLKHFFSAHTRLLLVTVEFPEQQLAGPPFSVNKFEVERLFSGFTVECIATNELKDKYFAQRKLKVDSLHEKLYIIRLNNSVVKANSDRL